ncbi:MAG: PorT family protein [Gemmatimonadetes bacterium]|nr:PorT family protein [Gemmatimonadota bacterium]MYA64233.1 PorT family protein [Gemmatimonadota bacterium]MYB98753.1 PorT family protein [Gemmatimonadota bacterium]MYH53643.1 PorT family protein [Gemmatimonadota bacterium]MYI46049.1 PorT family protein [Gemmatimonadota bacterium]
MIRNHLGTIVLALAATTLAPSVPAAALAQTTVTISGGLNMASVALSEDEGVSPESVTRLAIGMSAGIPMSERLGLHLGAAYSQKGLSANVFGADITTEINYLEFTALAGIPLSSGDRASVHLLAGPALAFKLSCQASASFMGESLSEDCGDDGPKSMDLGLAGGARLEIGLSARLGVSLGALYNLGLTNMDDGDGSGTIRSRVLTLQAGVVLTGG